MIDWDDLDWFGIIFVGFIAAIIIAIVVVVIFAAFEPSYDEKVAKITEPQFIAYCDNSVANGTISGLKIKWWRMYSDRIAIYNMDGTKTTITATDVCTFREIGRSNRSELQEGIMER